MSQSRGTATVAMVYSLVAACVAFAEEATPEYDFSRCPLYSAEGFDLDLTPEQARGRFPDARWTRLRESREGQEVWSGVTPLRGRTMMAKLTTSDAMLAEIVVDYIPSTGRNQLLYGMSRKYDAGIDALRIDVRLELVQRLGEPDYRGGLVAGEGHVPSATWIDEPCDRVLALYDGEVWKINEQTLHVKVARYSSWQAGLDTEAARLVSSAGIAAVDSSADCSLLGMKLGMSLGELKSATPGLKWWKVGQPNEGRQYHVIDHAKDLSLPRTYIHAWISHGAVDELRVEARPRDLDEGRAQWAFLNREVLQSFGAPAGGSPHAAPDGIVRTSWTSAPCGCSVTWEHGRTALALGGMQDVIGVRLASVAP